VRDFKVVGLGAAVAFSLLAGCDALLGLGPYQIVDCAFDCGVDAGDASVADVHEASVEADVRDSGPVEADADAEAGGEAEAEAEAQAQVPDADAGWPLPTAHQSWAHWLMPNPDASIAPDSSTLLPNQMAYDTGADGGADVVLDSVTGLSWWRQGLPATTLDAAWQQCQSISPGAGWRVPTRIELVSLIDFTHVPTINTVFPTRGDIYWTSSPVATDAGVPYWSVSFATGLVMNDATSANYVRCVLGDTQ
jgi:hypothetical protein